jgi:hypothetical protein
VAVRKTERALNGWHRSGDRLEYFPASWQQADAKLKAGWTVKP